MSESVEGEMWLLTTGTVIQYYFTQRDRQESVVLTGGAPEGGMDQGPVDRGDEAAGTLREAREGTLVTAQRKRQNQPDGREG